MASCLNVSKLILRLVEVRSAALWVVEWREGGDARCPPARSRAHTARQHVLSVA
jgi:hypothetical protein